MTEKPLQQLPHVREFVGPLGCYTVSLIGLGYEARRQGHMITACPYGDDDPDGVCWWMLGWIRCDRFEVSWGRPSLWKSRKK
jgi:hypothetical protein